MRPSSSPSELFGAVLGRGEAPAAASAEARLDGMLTFEGAQARAGLISEENARAIAAVCAGDFAPAEIGAGAGAIGSPAGALVQALRARTDAMAQEHERAAGAWHAEWRPLCVLLVDRALEARAQEG